MLSQVDGKVSLTYPPSVPEMTAKKKCCKDKPRCKKCPVVLKRLADAGCAERLDLRHYVVDKKVKKKVLKKARER